MEKLERITEDREIDECGLSKEEYKVLLKAEGIGDVVQNEMPITGMAIYTYQREIASMREEIEHYTQEKQARVGKKEIDQHPTKERYEMWVKAKEYERAVKRYIEYEGTEDEIEKRKEKLINQLNTLEKETLEYLEGVRVGTDEYMRGIPVNTNRKGQ